MVGSFCERLKWMDIEALVTKFTTRVWLGVKQEIVALTEIPYVKGARARLLYKGGLRTPEAVAAADVERLLEILLSGTPHGAGGKNQDQQRKIEMRAAKMILNVR
jgi:DNA polymerase theta